MSEAVLCPVCVGSGFTPTPGYTSCTKQCHGCNGKGWVEVGGDAEWWPSPEYGTYTGVYS